jgi:hypothetical protein
MVLLALLMTSSTVENFNNYIEGPKISSLAIMLVSWTLEKTVGSMKYPLFPCLFPPHSNLAPYSTPLWMYPKTFSN